MYKTNMNSNVTRTILVGQKLGNIPQAASSEFGIRFPNRATGQPDLLVSYDRLSTGLLLLGGTGSGKSNVYLQLLKQISEQMTAQDVALVFDPKGEFLEALRQSRSSDTRLVLISSDPADAAETSHWNIYEELICAEPSEQELMSRELANSLFAAQINGSNQPFFGIAAADLFAFVLTAQLRQARSTGNFSSLNNHELLRFFGQASLSTFHDLIEANPDFRYLTTYIGAKGQPLNPQSLGVLGVLNSTVKSMLIGPFGSAGKPFSMARLTKHRGAASGGTIIVLRYMPRHKNALETILSLLISQFIKETLSRKDGLGNTYLILDELAMLPHVCNLQDACNFGRSRGVRIIGGLQSITQLEENYKEHAAAIAAGFTSCIAFRSVDDKSREYVSKRFGKTYENLTFGGQNVHLDSFTIRDGDQRNLTVGEAFVDLPGEAPFFFQFRKFEP